MSGASGVRVSKKPRVEDWNLAERLEDSRLIRDILREHGRLIRWPSKETINVFTMPVLGLNSGLMSIVADVHCSSVKTVKPPGIFFLKAQVRFGDCDVLDLCLIVFSALGLENMFCFVLC